MTSIRSVIFALIFAVGCGPVDVQQSSQAAKLPAYLVGTYSRGTRVENNVSVDAEDRAIRFTEDGRYFYRQNRSWSAVDYRVEVTDLSVIFVEGPLKGQMLALASVSPNCRIVKVDGDTLYRDDEVQGCAMSRQSALSARDCEIVGTWTQSTRTGDLTDLREVTTTVRVEADHFFVRSRSTTRCTGRDCRYDEARPEVGVWADARTLGLAGFVHAPPAECSSMTPRRDLTPLTLTEGRVALSEVEVPQVEVAPEPGVEPTAYGRCASDAQCHGSCGPAGVCTSDCKFDVDCASPGGGMIASCMGNRCVATCSSGNRCPSGTVCSDGRCL